jgi:hypothetical protein
MRSFPFFSSPPCIVRVYPAALCAFVPVCVSTCDPKRRGRFLLVSHSVLARCRSPSSTCLRLRAPLRSPAEDSGSSSQQSISHSANQQLALCTALLPRLLQHDHIRSFDSHPKRDYRRVSPTALVQCEWRNSHARRQRRQRQRAVLTVTVRGARRSTRHNARKHTAVWPVLLLCEACVGASSERVQASRAEQAKQCGETVSEKVRGSAEQLTAGWLADQRLAEAATSVGSRGSCLGWNTPKLAMPIRFLRPIRKSFSHKATNKHSKPIPILRKDRDTIGACTPRERW